MPGLIQLGKVATFGLALTGKVTCRSSPQHTFRKPAGQPNAHQVVLCTGQNLSAALPPQKRAVVSCRHCRHYRNLQTVQLHLINFLVSKARLLLTAHAHDYQTILCNSGTRVHPVVSRNDAAPRYRARGPLLEPMPLRVTPGLRHCVCNAGMKFSLTATGHSRSVCRTYLCDMHCMYSCTCKDCKG